MKGKNSGPREKRASLMTILVIVVTLAITGCSSMLVSAGDLTASTPGYRSTPTRTVVQRTPQSRPMRIARPTPLPRPTCAQPFKSVAKPLTELGKFEYVRMEGGPTGFTGGLYPNGSNVRPPAHAAAGLAAAKKIQPLDTTGRPDPNGKIGMISVGMSNTAIEFGQFQKLAKGRKDLNPHLVIINGALASQTAEKWADPQGLPWSQLQTQLKLGNVTPKQVQVAWVKETLTRGGEFPAKAVELEKALEDITHNLSAEFPNLEMIYFSSRTRSYTYFRGLSPEPVAYETGFAVKWLVEKQIRNDPALNFDPKLGTVRAPYITWGPYLWIDGENPRADGQTWQASDMEEDCTHPSPSGASKVADMLMTFFMTDPTATWFRAR
jgi:hypothetical protein